jgi:lipopolysaccharide export system permease protein
VLQFTSHDLPIDLPKLENFRQRGERSLEFTLPELARLGRNATASEALRDHSRAEFHFRLAEVATMFLLPLLAVALGVPPKRSGSALGVFLAVVMIVTFYKLLEYAQAVGEQGRLDPAVALWVPFILFAALVGWMYHQIAYVPGGQPIAALERGFTNLIRAVARRLPGRRRERTA